MYTLKVVNGGVTIVNRSLTEDECLSIKSNGIQWICDAFMMYIGLDISDYTIKEYSTNQKDYFLIHIRPEDLIKLRDRRLDCLFKL
jgi:hypothetical protein